jgi:hypothetical protein
MLTVPLNGLVQQRQYTREGGLAAAAGASQADGLSGVDGEADVGDHRVAVAGGDVLDALRRALTQIIDQALVLGIPPA